MLRRLKQARMVGDKDGEEILLATLRKVRVLGLAHVRYIQRRVERKRIKIKPAPIRVEPTPTRASLFARMKQWLKEFFGQKGESHA